jgi:hypothetical protein
VEEQDRATDKEREVCMSTKHGRRWGRSCRLECMSLPFSSASHTSLSLSVSLSVFLSVFLSVGKSLGFVIMSGSSDSVAWELGFWVINKWWICEDLGFWSLMYLLDGLKDLKLLLCFCALWRWRSIDLFRSRSLVDSRSIDLFLTVPIIRKTVLLIKPNSIWRKL